MYLRKSPLTWVLVVAVVIACNMKILEALSSPTNPVKLDRPIRGKVIDAETEKPIQEFTVFLSPPVRDYYIDPRSPEFKITATYELNSETGEFQITDFAGDACAIMVKANGFVHGILWDYVIRGSKQWRLSELWTEEPLVFRLQPGGIIRGRVIDAHSKKPVAEARVVLNDPMGDAARHKLPPWRAQGRLAETKTDAGGTFTLEGIAFGTHWLRVTHPRFLAEHVKGLQLDVKQRQTDVEIAVEPAAGITGRVLDSAGNPVEGANVIASVMGKSPFLQTTSFVHFATTNENGRFELGPLEAGMGSVAAAFSRPGVVCLVGFARDVPLKKGTITEVNLRPIKDAATLIIKVGNRFPMWVFVCTSTAGQQAYGLVHPEDRRLLALGIDCIATGMFYQGKPDAMYLKSKSPEMEGAYVSPAAGDVPAEESRTFGSCRVQNLPAGTYFVHAGGVSQKEVHASIGMLIGGTTVTLAAGETREVTVDLSQAAEHPRRPLLGDHEKIIKRIEESQEQPRLAKPRPRRPEPQDVPPRPTITNSIGMKFAHIPAGSFLMGSSMRAHELAERYQTQASHFYAEEVQFPVTISHDFYLGVYEVTQAQWQTVMGNNPAAESPHGNYGLGDEYPVYGVSWDHCQEFIKKLNEKENTTAYRLPTEAEWEYACRVGSTTLFHFGDSESELADYAWYKVNADRACHPVGLKKPNAWGLYDMIGNVTEWCEDTRWTYPEEPQTDPLGQAVPGIRIRRGGSWSLSDPSCRSAARSWGRQQIRYMGVGFRLAKDVTE